MQLSELKAGLSLVGLEPDLVCTVVAVNVIADGAVQVSKVPEGTFKKRLAQNCRRADGGHRFG